MAKLLCWLLLAALVSAKVRYDNHQVLLLLAEDDAQEEALKELANSSDGLHIWTRPGASRQVGYAMVPPDRMLGFKKKLDALGIKSEVHIADMQASIDAERTTARSSGSYDWTDYYDLETINAFLDSLVSKYPGVVTPLVGGDSYEGRKIRGVKLSFKEGNPGVFIEGGIHASEWVSPATVTYILDKLLTSEDPVIKDLAQSFTFYIFPVVNPDGYAYSHETDRLWRKNRRPLPEGCYGVDLNRNWDFHWGEAGASNESCNRRYWGPAPFSEVETRTLSEYITGISHGLDVYLSFHSYLQMILFPYGHSSERVHNFDELMSVGQKAVAAIAEYNGTQYQVGNVFDTIYPATGISMDWVRSTFDTRFTYTWELRDTGHYGFLLPTDQILGTAEEALRSVRVILQHAKEQLSGGH
ncbi:zinc carboxypeptidase-like isoform X1 [Periplaneta americana]|uniref:zinc carboxypeptidase-like isoform X1 n=1 Tax=Periplaneta americana TaxID=6978 RepID=UPI0037E93958